MTGGSSEKVTPPKIPDVRIPDVGLDPRLNDPRVRVWFDEHAAEMRSYAYGQRVLYGCLAIAIVLGLVAHSAGYLLRAAATTDLLGLLADLLYTLGFALWTGGGDRGVHPAPAAGQTSPGQASALRHMRQRSGTMHGREVTPSARRSRKDRPEAGRSAVGVEAEGGAERGPDLAGPTRGRVAHDVLGVNRSPTPGDDGSGRLASGAIAVGPRSAETQ